MFMRSSFLLGNRGLTKQAGLDKTKIEITFEKFEFQKEADNSRRL